MAVMRLVQGGLPYHSNNHYDELTDIWQNMSEVLNFAWESRTFDAWSLSLRFWKPPLMKG